MKTETAYFEAAAGLSSQLLPSDFPEIAFAGKSNVGKSSLINKLLNRKGLARTSSTPGKTVTVNFYRVGAVRFVDLPGYGYAKVAHTERLRWSELMEGYFSGGRALKLVIQLLDMRHAPSAEDMDMLHYLEQRQVPYLIVLTKSDKLNQKERAESIKQFAALQESLRALTVIPFSALNGEGTAEALQWIEKALSSAKI